MGGVFGFWGEVHAISMKFGLNCLKFGTKSGVYMVQDNV